MRVSSEGCHDVIMTKEGLESEASLRWDPLEQDPEFEVLGLGSVWVEHSKLDLDVWFSGSGVWRYKASI